MAFHSDGDTRHRSHQAAYHNTNAHSLSYGTDQAYGQMFPSHPTVRIPADGNANAVNSQQTPATLPSEDHPADMSNNQRTPRTRSRGNTLNFSYPQAVTQGAQTNRSSRSLYNDQPDIQYHTHDPTISPVQSRDASPTNSIHTRPGFFPASGRDSQSQYSEAEGSNSRRIAHRSSFVGVDHQPRMPETQQAPETDLEAEQLDQFPSVNMKSWAKSQQEHGGEKGGPEHSKNREDTIRALTAAVAAGMRSHQTPRQDHPVPTKPLPPLRMPFDRSSSATAEEINYHMPQARDLPQFSEHGITQTPRSGTSAGSAHPLMGSRQEDDTSHGRTRDGRKLPPLDMEAVREMHNRGSTTSLTDLIKRATRLAANLDRGKTASRLGMLDVFASSEKNGHNQDRDSTMSDMILAFPPPANATPTGSSFQLQAGQKEVANTRLENERKAAAKPKRRVCGMSMTWFIIVMIIVVLLVAAAVVIPIFLILVPKQNESNAVDLGQCNTLYPCRNGGTSVVANNACACVCSNAFTGSQCASEVNTESCVTADVSDGGVEYNNATMGSSIMPLVLGASFKFGIPINGSRILSLFAAQNLTCAAENYLVALESAPIQTNLKHKRLVIVPAMGNTGSQTNNLPGVPPFGRVPGGHRVVRPSQVAASLFQRRQEAPIQTSNGIVFAATSTAVKATTTVQASESVSAVTVVSSRSTPTTVPSNQNITVTSNEVDFAQLVILYVLDQSLALSSAVQAQQRLDNYLAASSSDGSSEIVDVGFGSTVLKADFGSFQIQKGDGSRIGTGSVSS